MDQITNETQIIEIMSKELDKYRNIQRCIMQNYYADNI